MTFQLDTSGHVGGVIPTRWDDLSPFTQGYIEALFSSPIGGDGGSCLNWSDLKVAFSDLAPETLTRILTDCEAMQGFALAGTAVVGASAWRCRQGGLCLPDFPPLTVQLGDDGKVRFAEPARSSEGEEG